MWLKKAFILVTLLALTYGCKSSHGFRFEEDEAPSDKTTEELLEPQIDQLVDGVDRHERHIELVEDVERVQSEAEEVVVAGTEDHLEPQDDKFREEKKIGSLVEDLEGEEEIQPRFLLKDKLCALGLADVST